MVTAHRSLFLFATLLVFGGCVYEDQCTEGFARGADGRCANTGTDGGTDASDTGTSDADTSLDARLDASDARDSAPPLAIADFSVGEGVICAIDTEGRLLCWGANINGALATGDVSAQTSPVEVALGAPVSGVSVSLAVCASTTAPDFHCWGSNEGGMVGNGTTASPVSSAFLHEGIGSIRTFHTAFLTTCLIDNFGGGQCWGRNDRGQLAVGDTTSVLGPETPPRAVLTSDMSEIEAVDEVSVGDRHTCFRTADDSFMYCAGNNNEGQLGIGSDVDTPYAALVPGLDSVTSIDAAASHTCAVSRSVVYCWGENEQGQVQPASATLSFESPAEVGDVGLATQVATGEKFSCALLTSGEVTCWGSREHGALGDGAPTSMAISLPTMVSGLSDVTKIEASILNQICALDMRGELFCWGEDGIVLLAGTPDGATTYLDGTTLHTSPVRVDPLM